MQSNLTIKCRGCLVEESKMHNLFHLLTDDDDLTLANILSETTSTLVENSKEISPYLCTQCTKIVVDFYNFKVEFAKSQAYFQSEFEKIRDDSFMRVVENQPLPDHIILLDSNEGLENITDINKQLLQLESKETLDTRNKDSYNEWSPIAPLCSNIDDNHYNIMPEVGEFTVENELVQLIESVVFCCKDCDKEYLLKDDFLQHMNSEHNKVKVDASKFTRKTLVKLPLGKVFFSFLNY